MKFEKSKLRITPASFHDANELRRAIGEAIQKGGISLGKEIDFDNILQTELTPDLLQGIIAPILSTVNSREVEAAIFKCAEKAIYGNDKIDLDFFEKVENRPLYFQIMFEVAKENLSPFFGGLSSGLNTVRGKIWSILGRK